MSAQHVIERVYRALGTGDRAGLMTLFAPGIEAWFTAGLPAPIGGHHHGVDDCLDNGWWAIGARYRVRSEPEQYVPCVDGSLLVLGTYHGTERRTGREIEAAFAHHWTLLDDRVISLQQYTDTAAWLGATAGADA